MPAEPLLRLEDVTVAAGEDIICRNIDLTVNEGETHILIGPNGSGKSSLLCALMGVRPFRIVSGVALFRGEPMADMAIDERARAGIGMAFQRPPSLTGVSVGRFADAMGAGADFDAAGPVSRLGVGHLRDRDVNRGFSGGEVKRWEVAKLALQSPQLCLFDEPESGVDVEQVGVVAQAIDELIDQPMPDGRRRAAIIITHTGFVLDGVDATIAHLMIDGRIVASDDAEKLFDTVRHHGYAAAADGE